MNEAFTQAAEKLIGEHRGRVHFTPFATRWGIADVPMAYAVQREYVRLQMRDRGTGAAGYKIGLTSKRMQDMCGIDSPIAGTILRDRLHPSGACLDASAYGRPGLEFEIAVRLARDLQTDGAIPGLADVAAAVDAVCPAIEIIDDRHCDYGGPLEVLSVIADNAWNAGIVLGGFERSWPDLTLVEGVVSIDGTVVDRGYGRDVLGHPFHSVAWLCAHLSATGTPLRGGDIVMTGSLVTTKFPDRAASYRFDVNGLGAVALSFVP